MPRPSLQPDSYPIGSPRMAMDARMPGRDEDDDRDPIEVLRAYLEPKLAAPDMDKVHRLLDAMSDKSSGRTGAEDRRRGARDAAAASGAMDSVLERFPGLARIRIG